MGLKTHSNCRGGGELRREIPGRSPGLSLRRQRMGNKGAVDRHQHEALDLTLREQHPVERIADWPPRSARSEPTLGACKFAGASPRSKKFVRSALLLGP